jgi:hypothetical protein
VTKIVNWLVAVSLIAVAGAAQADDKYYIQSGMFPSIGDIIATGFFETSGVGNNTVTGFDLTLKSGSQSVTLCSSALFGCTFNDFITGQSGIVDTGSQLICTANCLFYDDETSFTTPSGFLFSGGSSGAGLETEQYRLNGYQHTNDVAAPKGSFVIGGKSAMAAPEIDPVSAASGLTLLLGGLAVLLGSKRKQLPRAAEV